MNQMRDAAINIRAEPNQRDLIDQAAKLLGKNRSDFMLEAACERAQSILLDQVYFQIIEGQFTQFLELLDTATEYNSGLEKLLTVQPPWKVNRS